MLFKFIRYMLECLQPGFFLAGGGASEYQIQKSLRIRGSANGYLSRTCGVPTDNAKFTSSVWLKRGSLGTAQDWLGGVADSSNYGGFRFNTSNQIEIYRVVAGAVTLYRVTTRVFRDPSAWYHVVVVWDSNNATANDRVKLYVNGVEETVFTTLNNPAVTAQIYINANTRTQNYGRALSTSQFDGHIAEAHLVDGQALTAADSGMVDPVTGAWIPKAYSGSYGLQGSLLKFDDGTSLTTLGNDESTNNNNWTLNNVSITAGVAYDWMEDTPTNNFPVINPLVNTAGSVTIADANLKASIGAADKIAHCSMAIPNTGKYYYEYHVTTVGSASNIGLSNNTVVQSSGTGFTGGVYRLYAQSGNKVNQSGGTAYGATFTTGDVIGIAVDAGAGTIAFYKNNVSQGVAFSDLVGDTWFPAVYMNGATGHFNFGQRPFTYTPPAGYQALCTRNLPVPTIKRGDDYFVVKTHTGNGTTQNITGVRFSPNLVWMKPRNNVYVHAWYDTERGAGNTKSIASDSTAAQGNFSTNHNLTSFNADGFSLGTTSSTNTLNGAAVTVVDWLWKEAVTAGLDIITYTGNATNRTIAHSLGVAPKLVIAKNLGGVDGWVVWHSAIAGSQYLLLSSTAAVATGATIWNSTVPTSSVISVGTATNANASGNSIIMYAFAEIDGFSKIGTYTGNGSADGPFVWCGFRPRWILIKNTSAATGWLIYDTARDTDNINDTYLGPETSVAESAVGGMDILSNGFKQRTTQAGNNTSAQTYIFMAFAECPYKYANAR